MDRSIDRRTAHLRAGGVPGRFLAEAGLQLPVLWPEQALVLHLQAV